MTAPTFNLVDEPWIPVVVDGQSREVSLREALTQAHRIRGLDHAEPLEAVAVLRQVLLPALWDATGLPTTGADWGERWNHHALDSDQIDAYLSQYRDAFDLFDPEKPFAQAPGLTSATGATKPVAVLIASQPSGNNVPLFGVRTEATPQRLDAAAATRALLAALCFDSAGIKTGAVGDPSASRGKTTGNPIGPVGQLGVCIPVGQTLAQTLLLNTPILPQGLSSHDRPQWRGTVQGPSWTRRPALGVLDLLTFQSRRIRLIPGHHEQGSGSPAVGEVVLCAGDRLEVIPTYEPHTRWRTSQDKETQEPTIAPFRFQSGKAAWRGLDSLLAIGSNDSDAQTSALVAQAASMQLDGYLASDFPLDILTIGVVYGLQQAVVEDVAVDQLPLPMTALLTDNQMRGFVLAVTAQAEALRKAANSLQDSLRRAAGGDPVPWDKSQRAGDDLIARLGPVVRRLLAGLQAEPDRLDEAEAAWLEAARTIALDVGQRILDAAPATSFLGRTDDKGYFHQSSNAEARYRRAVRKALPVIENLTAPEGSP